ncbi:MAG: phosphatase PAP2 family protein [Synechococcaceae bacterium WB6_1B_055]|nr:phosphatase PAP2 family protein [Synechococcaceae bacterium WB6_1B_055]NBP98133.1 phosphatase PAP2 family protein [Synechococcaceae bacterium WB6_3A_227]NCU91569.1 phosphatase PAP2 family protein [Synechococcaceae bacterium WB7_1B_046]NDA75802.1 phosphatase PAP2 family protein [Synechococcaceae bacterium WB8_3_299]NDD21969.1 phosphatase PAP2 family protein [Synechococcaceae bacterium WBA_3_309]
MSKRISFLLAAFLLATPVASFGQEQKLTELNAATGLKLSADKYKDVIGTPPLAGSADEASDLSILRWNQRSRNPEGVIHSWRFLYRNLSSFDAAVGSDLSKSAPILFKELPAFLKEIDNVKDQLKDAIARPRPYVSFKEFQPCLPLESTWSYPSGHATWYAATSLLLSDLIPARAERLQQVGSQGGYARAYCGVHYPSDVLASQKLAVAITKDVIASEQWQIFKEKLKSEIQKLMIAPPAGLPLLTD